MQLRRFNIGVNAGGDSVTGSRAGRVTGATLLALLGSSLALPLQAATQDEEGERRLNTVVVQGARQGEAQKARVAVEKIAGAASVVDNKEVEKGRASNAEDVLALQPGVYAQATSGTGANKISIRGSGVNTFYQGYALGLKFLYDGLPITGPGGTQEDLLNMAGVNYTEVLNGANAFAYSALSLGGAINFVTHTGHSAPGHYIRVEGGSFGYRKQQLSTGGVVGDSDYYVSILRNERDGFQDDTPNKGKDFIANLGHTFNPKLETRLHIRYREEQLRNGTTLTKAQIKNDPRQNPILTGRKKNGTTLIGSRTTYTLDDDSKVEFGLGYNKYPLHNGWRYSATPQDWESTDWNLTLRYLRTGDRLFGKPSDTTFTYSDTRLLPGDVVGYDRARNMQVFQKTDYSGSRDTVFSVGNELQLAQAFWLSSGLSFINIDRYAEIEYTNRVNTTAFGTRYNYDEWDIAPRLGFRYQVLPELQLFGNVSRSIDAPVTWQIGSTGVPYVRPLVPQKANTVEFGVRGVSDRLEGSLVLYRSWIKDELLTTVVVPATPTSDAIIANSNASPTIHQGIEAGLAIRLWEGQQGDSLTLRQAYTFNDFFYRDDDAFGDNELPSMPRHVYQAELQYQQASGFYASLGLRSASSYYVDYANTLSAPSFLIWNAKVGYEAPGQRWSVFLDARNLTDENYATAANTTYNAAGRDSANFYPGDGFGVTTGVSLRF